jgi:hypothetical protein
MKHEFCNGCEEKHENCGCKGFAVIIDDELTEQTYVGLYQGFKDGLFEIECEGIKMWFSPDAATLKREDNYE